MAKIHHFIFSTPREKLESLHNKDGDSVVEDYMASDKFTPEEYVQLLTNQFNHHEGDDDKVDLNSYYAGISDELSQHRHATPENNQKILEHHLKEFKDWRENEFDPENPKYFRTPANDLGDIYRKYSLPEETIEAALDNPEEYGFYPEETEDALWRPSLDKINSNSIKKEHLYKIADKHPSSLSNYLDHPEADDHLIDTHVMGNPDVLNNLDSHSVNLLSQREGLTGGHAKQLLENTQTYENTFHRLLDKLPEDERNSYLDGVLGITGGKHHDKFDEEDLREDGVNDQDLEEHRKTWSENDNWENWNHGWDHNQKREKFIASYSNLSDKHADHIMRHGRDADAKIALYNNEDLDPKHAVQMYDKWAADDSHHGYDKEEFLTKLKEEHEDDVREDFYEQAREEVERDNPLSDYLNDYGHEHIDAEALQDHHDDIHDQVHETYSDEEDWLDDNPDHNEGLWKQFQKIQSHVEKHGLGDQDTFDKQQLNQLGIDTDDMPMDIAPDDDEEVSLESLRDEYKQHAPQINYSNHDEYSIHDHPDYQDRLDEAAEDYKSKIIDGWNSGNIDVPESVYESYDEWNLEDRYSRESELMQEHFEGAMDNEDYIPQHVKDNHPEIHRVREERRQREEEEAREKVEIEENRISGFLDEHIPERSKEHEYGDGLHHHEMLQNYAKENNGKIDMGRMAKLHPNLKDTWKNIFAGKGKLTSEEIDQKIEELPKNKYAISYKDWSGAQRTNDNKQIVFRLDHTDDSVAALKEDSGVYDTFKNVQEVSRRSGHPTNNNTIAWSRVDTEDPKHWFIDEVQSDFGSAARDYLKNEGATEKAGHIDKIIDHHKDWRENITNHIIKEAKKHGVEKISTHSPESKAAHNGSDKVHGVYKDSYKKIPRKMGFKAADSSDFPLDEKGQKVFTSEKGSSGDYSKHAEAFDHHQQMFQAHHYNNSQEGAFDDPGMDKKFRLADYHKGFARRHLQSMKRIDPTMSTKSYDENLKPGATDGNKETWSAAKKSEATGEHLPHANDSLLDRSMRTEAHQGHTLDLRPKALQKSLEVVDLLVKTEYLYNLGLEQGLNVDNLKKNIEQIEKSLYKGMDLPYTQESHNRNKWLVKADLMKGSFQKKNRFNPLSVDPDVKETQREWTHDEDQDVREEIPKIEGAARKRALNKLHGKTDVKKHPKTNERMFLMHRGVGEEEYRKHHQEGKANYKGSVQDKSSWTPDHKVASDFGEYAVSAWIPESSLVHNPNQFNSPSKQDITNKSGIPVKGGFQYSDQSITEKDEGEWIVSHDKSFHHANMDAIAGQKQSHEKINRRSDIRTKQGQANKSNVKGKALEVGRSQQSSLVNTDNIRQPSKLAASEKLENNLNKKSITADEETEIINENKKKPKAKVKHKFKAAQWTHPNGHPRCIICGDEERDGKYCIPSTNKWTKRAKIIKNEDLDKGEGKNLLAGLAASAVLLHGAHQIGQPDNKASRAPANIVNPEQHREQVVKEAPDTGLKIDMLSAFRKNPITDNRFLGESGRHGKYGLHSNTIKNTINKDSGLKNKYKNMLTMGNTELRQHLSTHPHADQTIVSKHWNNLQKEFGNKADHIAHAWYHGPEATKKEIRGKDKKTDLYQHPYVSKIMRHLNK